MSKVDLQPDRDSAPSTHDIKQTAQNIGKNSTQVSGNYNSQQTLSMNLVISVFFISILSLGGIAWVLNVGWNFKPSQNNQSPSPTQVQK